MTPLSSIIREPEVSEWKPTIQDIFQIVPEPSVLIEDRTQDIPKSIHTIWFVEKS